MKKGTVLFVYFLTIPKNTQLNRRFFLSFNPQSGPSIDPVIESGTVTIKKVNDGLFILVDCKEEGGEKFTMNLLAKDEQALVDDWK